MRPSIRRSSVGASRTALGLALRLALGTAALGTLTVTAGIVGCATSTVERKSESPRVVRLPGTGEFRWDEGTGWIWPERGDWGTAEAIRAEAFLAYQAGFFADALAGFSALETRVDESSSGEAAAVAGNDLNFYIAECYFQLGNYADAIDYYREVYRHDFPSPYLLDQAQRRVYEIGLAYLHGDVPCEYVGLIRLRCPDRGVDILAGSDDGLIVEFPLLDFADDALIEIANYYYGEKEYPEAVPLYDRVASYRESEWADQAEFRAAEATFLQVRGVDYDQRTLQDAERRFTAYLERDPPGSQVAEAREYRETIREMEGEKNLRVAKFYLRESQPEASELYLDRVIRDYPNSKAAREAREIQRQLDRIKEGL